MATMAVFEPSTADHVICSVVDSAEEDLTLTQVADALFPQFSPQWVRERCRRLALAGMIEIDHTRRPATVRLAGRRS